MDHNSLLDLTDWTVSAWVYANNPDSGGVILEKGILREPTSLAFNHSGGSPARQPYAFYEQANGTDVKITATGTNLENQWSSIIASRDNSFFKLYVNGTEAASSTHLRLPKTVRVSLLALMPAPTISSTEILIMYESITVH